MSERVLLLTIPVLQHQWPEDVTVTPQNPADRAVAQGAPGSIHGALMAMGENLTNRIPQKAGCTGPQPQAQKLTTVFLCRFSGHYLIDIRFPVPVSLHLVNL